MAAREKKAIAKKQKTQRGQVGPRTVAAVDQLVKAGMKKSDAFKKVAADSGRSVGTVTVTYYRLTSKKGPKKGAKGPRSSAGSVAQLLGKLAKAVKAQEAEIAQLKKDNARFEELRRLLK